MDYDVICSNPQNKEPLMLVLSRKKNESIVIADDITITVIEMSSAISFRSSCIFRE